MKRIGGFLTMVVFAMLVCGCMNAFAYTISDPSSTAYISYGPDRIGELQFELYGMNVTQTQNQVIFDIFTNFPKTGFFVEGGYWADWNTMPADLALDVNGVNGYEYGLVFTGSNAGMLYSNATWNTSNVYDPYHNPGYPYIYHENEIVKVLNGTAISANNTVSWIKNDNTNNLYNNISDWRINVALNKSDFLPADFNGSINVFYGGATCANDFINGTVKLNNSSPVPEPATCSLLGLGLIGLIGRFAKRKS
jgi:hypothetical protein